MWLCAVGGGRVRAGLKRLHHGVRDSGCKATLTHEMSSSTENKSVRYSLKWLKIWKWRTCMAELRSSDEQVNGS